MAQVDIIVKLKIPIGVKILVKNGPEFYNKKIQNQVILAPESNVKYSFIHLFATNKAELNKHFTELLTRFDDTGYFWISYPKKSSGIETDLSRNESWDIFKVYNYRPVSQISIDETWSAIRARPSGQVKVKKKNKIVEINFQTREVFPPADLQSKLEEFNLSEKFKKLSFTHRKEYVESIVEAKKQETRERRILKTIETLKK
jgi:hypothetical protein